jgi:hypothetical protein
MEKGEHDMTMGLTFFPSYVIRNTRANGQTRQWTETGGAHNSFPSILQGHT